MEPSIYVINRREDDARLSQFAKAADGFSATFQRIPAFDGHDPLAPFFLYQHLLGDTFWGKPDIKPGAFACYLSHFAAWRKFLASDAELALICEDDAIFTRDPAEILAEGAELEFDVLLANARMADWRRTAGLADGDVIDVADVLAAMIASGQRPSEGIAAAAWG